MANITYTTEMLATLQTAIASGVRSVYYGDKRVDYRSLDEMIRIQNIMLQALGLALPQQTVKLASFRSGFNRRASCIEGGMDNPYNEDGFYSPYLQW